MPRGRLCAIEVTIMTTHAMAFVKWDVFRPGRERPTERSFKYASRQRRLITLVGNGGTLWLVTSRRTQDGALRYSLAYKLVDCVARTPDPAKEERFGPNMVYGQDWIRSVHFPYNDATGILRRLRFASGPPMSEVNNIGFRLQGIPRLAEEDVALLEAFQQKVLSERTVFLSYDHDDSAIADQLEVELGARNVHLFRDTTALQPGEDWEPSLRRAAHSSDYLLVLVSERAAQSEWVKREILWALAERREGGLVERIIPLILTRAGWEGFPELHPFQGMPFPETPDAGFWDHLARQLQAISRRRR
jgi:hypothetical protein